MYYEFVFSFSDINVVLKNMILIVAGMTIWSLLLKIIIQICQRPQKVSQLLKCLMS